VVKLDATGQNIQWENTLGGNLADNLNSIQQTTDGGYIFGGDSRSNASADKSEPRLGNSDIWVVKLDATGQNIEWDITLGGVANDKVESVQQTTDDGYILGGDSWSDASATKSEDNFGRNDYWVIKLACLALTDTVPNDLSPASQSKCTLGTPDVILGTDDDGLSDDAISYLWQFSVDNIIWTDIAGFYTQHYQPSETSVTTYYRRISSWACENSDTSNVHTLNIGANTAPVADAGGSFVSCTGSPVTLGGSPTGTGGTAPLEYAWDFSTLLNDATLSNPVATATASTVFTVVVSDANGCSHIDQAVLKILSADAGPDVSICPGEFGKQIGTAPIAGLSVQYSWLPTTGLSSAIIAQPIADPSSSETYTLTMTFTNSDGAVCSSNDMVDVTVSIPPSTDFAGPDQTICFGTTTTIGTTAEAGFTYTWAPGAYLQSNETAQVVHDHGNITFPIVPDPITYYLTASDGTCAFYDEMVLTVLNAPTAADHYPAGEDGCGPRYVGHTDVTPFLNETYLWTKLASSTGTGTFLGATDTSLTTVSASGGGTDIYQLAISANSTTCRDTVEVPDCLVCIVDIEAEDGNCALGTGISLTATVGANFTYSWLPSTGLSSSTGSSVELLDNVNRTYTVTATSTIDPSHSCSESIEVSNPAWSYPVFTAQDISGCDGDAVNIGAATQPGYTYSWEYNGAVVSTISNPLIVIGAGTAGTYTVTVTDPVTGCFTIDNAIVAQNNVIADAGPDY
ncbi:MAG: hypothetical protein GY746_04690, partial [Gammaproteobacteria bacterium]|nr:hypothetical protein [Gammaproteobacteria bacterium]